MIGEIEQAIIDRFIAASSNGTLGYKLATVESYGNQLNETNLRTASQRFPAVLPMYAGERKSENAPGGGLRRFPTFVIFFCQQNRRNEESVRRGKLAKVGSYQMVEDGMSLLFRQRLGLTIDPIMPGTVRSVLNAGHMSIYSAEFMTSFVQFPNAVDVAALDDFSTFHSDWDIAPHGNVTAPLPASEADASDTIINLETT